MWWLLVGGVWLFTTLIAWRAFHVLTQHDGDDGGNSNEGLPHAPEAEADRRDKTTQPSQPNER